MRRPLLLLSCKQTAASPALALPPTQAGTMHGSQRLVVYTVYVYKTLNTCNEPHEIG